MNAIMLYMEVDLSERLDDLPLFPLATVLFPGAILPLHVFEDRYKKMIRHAVENGGLFGLSFCNEAFIGRETPPRLGSIGCLARINAVMPLSEGKMNVISSGLIRYRVVAFNQMLPFLLARVKAFNDDLEPGADLTRLHESMLEMSKEFLAAVQALEDPSPPINQELPEDAEGFSLVIASALPIDNEAKQKLLEMTSTRLRLTRVRQFMMRALEDYNERIKIQERAKGNGHGKLS